MNRLFNWLGQMRVDVPHLRLVESSIVANFDLLGGSVLAGGAARVVRGFEVLGNSGAATALQLNVAGAILMHPLASETGTLFSVPLTRAAEVLNSSNTRVRGSFTASQVNFIGVDLVRAPDSTTSDLVQFLDAVKHNEVPKTVALGRTLDYVIYISTVDFSATPTIAPIAKVTTDANNLVTSVVNAQSRLFRLGTGGSVPDPFHAFPWSGGRTEPSGGTSFTAGDCAITSLKDWADATMTRMWELGGGEHWYSATADRNVFMTRAGTTFANGEWFEWDGTNLHWRGLTFTFDNSTGHSNAVKDQLADAAGAYGTSATNLADGDCIYVDLDRTQNLSGGSSLVAIKAPLTTLGTPTVPGARQIIAVRVGANIYTRNSSFPVGATFAPATKTSLGVVELSDDPPNPLLPKVPVLNGSSYAIAAGLQRGPVLGAGSLIIGGGANDSSVVIGKGGSTTQIQGTLAIDTLDKNIANFITCNTGINITASVLNGAGLGATGNGLGNGVVGNGGGGGTGGAGVVGSGGGTAGQGGVFTGSGSGAGVQATPGATGNGLTSIGGATSGSAAYLQAATGSTSPIEQAVDQGGNIRAILDRNGYRMGKVVEYTQDWRFPESISGTGASTKVLEYSLALTGGGNAALSNPSTTTAPFPTILVRNDGGALNDRTSYYSTPLFCMYDFSSVVIEFSMGVNVATNAASTVYIGITDHASGAPDSGSNSAWITFAATGGSGTFNWNLKATGHGPDSGAAAASGPTVGAAPYDMHHFRIELYGLTSAVGSAAGSATTKIYHNGALLTTKSYVPVGGMRFTLGAVIGGNGVGVHSIIGGPIRICYNQMLTPPAL